MFTAIPALPTGLGRYLDGSQTHLVRGSRQFAGTRRLIGWHVQTKISHPLKAFRPVRSRLNVLLLVSLDAVVVF